MKRIQNVYLIFPPRYHWLKVTFGITSEIIGVPLNLRTKIDYSLENQLLKLRILGHMRNWKI